MRDLQRNLSLYLERVRDRLACRRRGHLWDTDRPAGPIHKRDICWRCNAVREEKR